MHVKKTKNGCFVGGFQYTPWRSAISQVIMVNIKNNAQIHKLYKQQKTNKNRCFVCIYASSISIIFTLLAFLNYFHNT